MGDLAFLREWIHSRASRGSAESARQDMVREFEHFFTYVFDNSPDGISILDLDFTILGVNTAMERWYAHARPIVGRKCYEVYHGRTSPCASCPSSACMRAGRPEVGVVPYEGPPNVRGAQELSAFPLFDDAGKMFCIIEYVREITDLNEEARTIETLMKRIQFQDQTLHEQEVALEVLLRRSDRAERRLAQDVVANISLSIAPLVSRLQEKLAGTDAHADIVSLDTMLRQIAAPLMGRLVPHLRYFTPREREIAGMVLEGRTSKEIAHHLSLTVKAVDFHRMNIRRKLHMDGSSKTLQARLSELDEP